MRKLVSLFCFCLLCSWSHAQMGNFFPADRFSSSLISDLCQDRYGNLWVATEYGLNRFDGYRFTPYLHNASDEMSLGYNTTTYMLCDRDGQLWVGTSNGLDRYMAAQDAFMHCHFPDSITPRVSCLLQLSDGAILVGTAGYGLFSVTADGTVRRENGLAGDSSDGFVTCLYQDAEGRLWKSGIGNTIVMRDGKKTHRFSSSVGDVIGFAEHGGEILVAGLHGLQAYRNGRLQVADIDMGDLIVGKVLLNTIRRSDEGHIYIGTRGGGLFRLAKGSRRVERIEATARGIDLNTAKVRTIFADRNANLWLGCDHKGLFMLPERPLQFMSWSFEAQKLNIGSYITSVCEGDNGITWAAVQGVGVYGFDAQGHVVAHPYAPSAIEFIFRDRQKNYWVGTDNGLYAYDPLTGRAQLKVTIECDRFNDMTSTGDGRICISTFSRGFCVYDPATGQVESHRYYERDSVKGALCNDWVLCMMPDRDGLIWMGTASGVSCYNPRTGSFRSQGWDSLLDDVFCFSLCELRDGSGIAIGTEQGLYLYDRKTRKLGLFPESEQLQDKVISYIVQSNNGDLWCATSMGIWQYDRGARQFTGHVNGNGLTTKEYQYGVGMHTDDDVIYFGTNSGLTVFRPADVKNSRLSPDSIQLTEFLIAGNSVNTRTVLNGVQITERAVSESDRFRLSYIDNTFTMVFSQLNYDNPRNTAFEYRVNDGAWLRTLEGENDITLSHMQPGTYRIEVRAVQGSSYSPVKQLTVVIDSPWYRTPLAYALYLLTVLGLVAFVGWNWRRRANQQLNEDKMKFLINATHDIRSPLTLIMAPLANLRRRIDDSQTDTLRDVETIEHNAKRILALVNQILDVRKIDKQQMHLRCQETDLVSFVRGICKMFDYNAQERGLQFTFTPDVEQLKVWVDRSQFDKVITNLLSNAFKYTRETGGVDVRLSGDETTARLQVIDTGTGLDEDGLKHVFDRFYQGKNSHRLHVEGTGIGLNLCKMIVDMHHGTIEAANRTDGQQGAVFTVTLPLGNAHLSTEEIEPEESAQTTVVKPRASSTAKYRVLIVDDDVEIGRYISTELGHSYKFSLCSNGKDGIRELLTNEYDLVVSDVMMPEMDGFTMLRLIKTNLNISHIPVIMLTSKADVGNRLEGLENGADAFLAKPFNMEELHMNIENLIHNRQRLKGKYSGAQQQADKLEKREVKGNDELLMERIMKAVNKNLSNSDFNVDMLTQEVGISRAQLHRKMKEITGISTSEFIRNIRLEQAARLLREQKINVTQVAYAVGFSNLAHFSTIFRKHFGVAPSEYADREKEH